jgi:FKBP-type peptidyl-prolyl cis-trans isomerase FklB
MTIDGEVFDSNEGIEFPLNGMIEGWKIALPEMTEGSKWEIYIPQEFAYGKNGSMPAIKPFSALVFEVELFSVTAPEAKKK